jgi:hypothetical protein
MPKVVRATRFALAAYAIGLLTVGVSATLRGTPQTIEQYYATIAFILACNAIKFGIWKDENSEPRWLRTTCLDSSKAFGVLIALAILGNLLTNAHTSVQPH